MSAPTIVPDVSSLKDLVGTDLGPSDWIDVTQERIDDFARATGDVQWIHVDVERAKRESPFGQTIAHGYLTVSLASVLLPQLLVVEKCSRIVNYGIDKLRLKEPVPAGAKLRIAGSVADVRGVPGGGARVSLALRWEVEGARRPACQGEAVFVYFP